MALYARGGRREGGQRHPPTYGGVCPLGAFVHHGPMEQDTLKVRPVGIPSGLSQPMAQEDELVELAGALKVCLSFFWLWKSLISTKTCLSSLLLHPSPPLSFNTLPTLTVLV